MASGMAIRRWPERTSEGCHWMLSSVSSSSRPPSPEKRRETHPLGIASCSCSVANIKPCCQCKRVHRHFCWFQCHVRSWSQVPHFSLGGPWSRLSVPPSLLLTMCTRTPPPRQLAGLGSHPAGSADSGGLGACSCGGSVDRSTACSASIDANTSFSRFMDCSARAR